MIDSYRMIVVNLIAVIFLVIGIIFYIRVYPKKHINLFILLILLSLLPLISILREGSYESGDLSLHAIRTLSLFESIKDGNILTGWAANLNATYGYPLFLFIYPLPYYLASLFHFIGFSLINSLKLLLALSYILSGIFMYIWIKKKLGRISAFIAAIFYLYSPYRFVDMHFRVAIGEVVSFIFLPVIFYACEQIIVTNKFKWWSILSVSLALLILSHQAVSIFFFPIIFAYGLIKLWYKRKSKIKSIAIYSSAFMNSILLAAFYLIPLIIERKYTLQPIYGIKAISFSSLSEFIYSPWRFGFLFQGPKGELSFVIGYIQLFLVLFSIYLLFKNKIKIERSLFKFSIITFFFLLFMMLPISEPLWQVFPLINNLQSSYRLLTLISLFTAIITGIIVKNVNNQRFMILICFIAIISTVLNWGNRKPFPNVSDEMISVISPSNTYQGEGLVAAAPRWASVNKLWIEKQPKSNIEIISGNAKIVPIYRDSINHEYIINALTNVNIKENTLYFPGWNLRINNLNYPINYTFNNYPGVITFKLNPGLYKVKLSFEDTPDRKLSKLLSLIAFLIIIFVLLFHLGRRLSPFFQRSR